MKVTIRFTPKMARQVIYALQQEHNISYNPELTEEKLEKLIKLNVLSVVAKQAQIDMERMEKLLVEIIDQD